MDKQKVEQIEVYGARVHNLKNINVTIPRNSLTVITGLSGSGKSSLAFDTIYAEGQRRYIETFSSYFRNFLDGLERPDVDEINGLSPVISIDQKGGHGSRRSTVGTMTEIYDYLRLLYARVSVAYSYATGKPMVRYTEEQIIQLILETNVDKRILILAPLVKNRKGHYKELFEQLRKKGYLYARIDGKVVDLTYGLKTDRYKSHRIELVVDKLVVSQTEYIRLKESIATAIKQSDGEVLIVDADENTETIYSTSLICPESGISYPEPSSFTFSFNVAQSACPKCKGIGEIEKINIDKLIENWDSSIYDGAIIPLGKYSNMLIFHQIAALLEQDGLNLKSPLKEISEERMEDILYGSADRIRVKSTVLGSTNDYYAEYEGVVNYIIMRHEMESSETKKSWSEKFSTPVTCPQCNGARLCKESLAFQMNRKNISELTNMEISDLHQWFTDIDSTLTQKQRFISEQIIKEIKNRLSFLVDIGVEYITLDRSSATLSGGERQRIKLATQIGSKLINVLYILDEPSIGLHQRDNIRLIDSLKELRDSGNTVVVVEHDRDMMLAADYIVDMGPGAGTLGGEVTFAGTPQEMQQANTLTNRYLTGVEQIEVPKTRRAGNGKQITLKGATGNNLKNIDVTFPLGKMICVTGVSGGGKSTLITGTLYPLLFNNVTNFSKLPKPYQSIEGIEHINKAIVVDQTALGRGRRSNPATYIGLFTDIRNLFITLPEAKIRGYKAGRFTFNTKGGRCEECQGFGYKVVEMKFLPEIHAFCEVCHGKRYNRETLEIRYKGKNIADILEMTVDLATTFFESIPSIYTKLKMVQDVGLGYISLGQTTSTLSGGECQRIKLAAELLKKDTSNTLYILDEPTTGLHFHDIKILLGVLNRLVDRGNTMIIIEHNLDVIKIADHVIDIGPEGGKNGGYLVAAGTPEQVAASGKGYTASFIKTELMLSKKKKGTR